MLKIFIFSLICIQFAHSRFHHTKTKDGPTCTPIGDNERFDCFPENGANENDCVSRGCCWRPPQTISEDAGVGIDVPYCYFPKDFPTYKVQSGYKNPDEDKETYFIQKSTPTFRQKEILNLAVDLSSGDSDVFRARIYDPNNQRYEVPLNVNPHSIKSKQLTDIHVSVKDSPFAIQIVRKSTQRLLFDTSVAPLIYADQFIQFSTSLPNNYIYGIGEHRDSLQHLTTWKKYTLWNRDVPPSENINLYGTHAFYLCIEPDGNAHGFFFLNSNGMDVVLQPYPAITFTTIGGIVDFFFYSGPTPADVIQQHMATIGRPFMIPYFTLGFHLCRWGYVNDTNLKAVIQRNRAAEIPYDVQWTDIDAMLRDEDWTYDDINFPTLPEIVQDLHDHGQHYINIMDPAISNTTGYFPYDSGLDADIFIKYYNSQTPLVGRVWPGSTVFPDFTHPNATEWWLNVAQRFHDEIPFDGLWIDMNEPSNFVDGSLIGCTNTTYDEPPYTPNVLDGKLYAKTICPSSTQYLSQHYNLHNMYGHFEAIATNKVLRALKPNKRPFVLSRSTYAGTGVYSAHWSGDNRATWKDLYYSIQSMLNFNMYGVVMIGADICGFSGDTTEELCIRWIQLGSFYPFMRNHNNFGDKDQDPAAFSTYAQGIMKSALRTRYTLLPYFYTLFYRSSLFGETVVRPLFFEFANDNNTHSIDQQFMVGPAVLVSPVLTPSTEYIDVYFPDATWYDMYEGEEITTVAETVKISAPLEKINVHIRGGYILPLQHPEVTTTASRKNPFGLLVALDAESTANGQLYWDDGESADVTDTNTYNLLRFSATEGSLQIDLDSAHRGYEVPMMLDTVRVLGVKTKPNNVTINGINHETFTYDDIYQKLHIEYFLLDMFKFGSVAIKWF